MITIKHKKTNGVTDWTQADLNSIIAGNAPPLPPVGTVLANVTLPSDWNDTHDITINTDDVPEGVVNKYYSNASTIASVLTGYVSAAGVISAADTILQAIQKLNGNITAIGTGYIPYTGATSNVDLGAHTLTVGTSVTSPSFVGALTGNATTATALQNPRTINGTSFDGTANIVVTAAAGTLTGATLNSTVTGSSLTSVGAQAQDLNMNSHKVTNVTDPSASQDAATKNYVDTVAQGLSAKQSAQLATAAALPANTYSNGASGVGATLTGLATGVLTVDGVAVALNDRIIIKNEVAGANNGLYKCTLAGAIGVAYVLTRATDADTSAELDGAFVFVEGGSSNTATGWVIANAGVITIGTTAISWTQFSGAGTYTAGNGLTLTGNQFTINTAVTVDKTTAQVLTNKDLTSGTNIFPTLNQNTTGSAAKWTTARALAGNSVDGSADVAFANKFIVQGTVDAGLSGAQFLGALGTGLLKNTTTTGILSIATAGTDYLTPSGAASTYVPYTGATGAVNLGTNAFSVNALASVTTSALGTTQSDTVGALIATTSAAALGAQQISPSLRFRGFGWGTTAGTSQSIDFRQYVIPTQGTTPTALLQLQSSIAGAAYTNIFSVSETGQGILLGNLSLNSVLASSILRVGATSQMQWNGRSNMFSPADGIILLQNNGSTDFARLQFGGTTASFPSIKRTTTALNFRLADDSADCGMTASSGVFSTTLSVTGHVTVESVTSTGATGTNKFVFDTSPTLATVAAASTFSAGTGTGTFKSSGLISMTDFSSNGNVTTAETDLITYTLPANSMAVGKAVEVRFGGNTASNSNTKTLRIYVGAVVVQTVVLTTLSTANWKGSFVFISAGSNTNNAEVYPCVHGTAIVGAPARAGPNVTETATIILKMTGQGTATNDITGQYFDVRFLN